MNTTRTLSTRYGSVLYAIDSTNTPHALVIALTDPQHNPLDRKPGLYATPEGAMHMFAGVIAEQYGKRRLVRLTYQESEELISRIFTPDEIQFS